MVEYDEEIERDFMTRTLSLIQEYDGPYDATLLVNCLLGLLIVPNASMLEKIPSIPFDCLEEWGVKQSSIKKMGNPTKKSGDPASLRGIVINLRNSVAHFRVKPLTQKGQCAGFEFENSSGFKASLSLEEMNGLIQKLASHLQNSRSSSNNNSSPAT